MSDSHLSPITIALMTLMKFKGIGRRTALRLLKGIVSSHTIKEDITNFAIHKKINKNDFLHSWNESIDQLESMTKNNIQSHSFFDADYPSRLKNIFDPPAILYTKGSTDGLHASKSLAVIGTRDPTPFGKTVSRKTAFAATQNNFVIVSGLAEGCDTLAHEGCLEANGINIAVMAHGLDTIYPAINRNLASRLLEYGGCLVSEYPPGTPPTKTAFADRDRLQSGLADAVLVIETDENGGTMNTVRSSLRQKRALFCIEHPPKWRTIKKTKGNQILIENRSAKPVPDSETLTTYLRDIHGHKPDNTPLAPEHHTDQFSMEL